MRVPMTWNWNKLAKLNIVNITNFAIVTKILPDIRLVSIMVINFVLHLENGDPKISTALQSDRWILQEPFGWEKTVISDCNYNLKSFVKFVRNMKKVFIITTCTYNYKAFFDKIWNSYLNMQFPTRLTNSSSAMGGSKRAWTLRFIRRKRRPTASWRRSSQFQDSLSSISAAPFFRPLPFTLPMAKEADSA